MDKVQVIIRASDSQVRITIEDGVGRRCLTRADKRNALDGAMLPHDRPRRERGWRPSRACRAVVLCGDGPSFCAGLDFSGMAALAAGGGDDEVSPGHCRRAG